MYTVTFNSAPVKEQKLNEVEEEVLEVFGLASDGAKLLEKNVKEIEALKAKIGALVTENDNIVLGMAAAVMAFIDLATSDRKE